MEFTLLVAELYYNGITRGATLEGADVVLEDEPPWPAPASAGDTPLWRSTVPIPLYAGQQYTECAQIYNPIHTEPSVAKAAGLPDMILHGSATKALSLSAVINASFAGDASRVTRLCGQLRGMVLMNSEIVVEALAEEVVEGEKRVFFRTLNAARAAAVSNGVVCGRA